MLSRCALKSRYFSSHFMNKAQSHILQVPYVKATEPHMLETYTPEVTRGYITSRLDSVAVVIRDGLEDPLEDQGMLVQQLEQISVIARCEYGTTCQLVLQLFDQAAQAYQELITNISTAAKLDVAIQEGEAIQWPFICH